MRPLVDVRSSLHLVAIVLQWLGLAFVAPLPVAAIYGESLWPWGISAGITSLLGLALRRITRESREIRTREASLVVAVSWLLVAAVGALPYLLLGALPPVDAFFESMSGFTATGSTVMAHLEQQPRSLLLWRALTQWLGGMGIIVLAIAVLPRLAVGGRQLMEAELPGPEVERLTPRIRETARLLWTLYSGLSVMEFLALMLTGLSPYEALIHAFTTLSTGGFGTRSTSFAPFSPATQWVAVVFMLLGGTNFALLYRGLRRPRRFGATLWGDEEFRLYLAVFGLVTLVLFLDLMRFYASAEAALRHSAFQVASILTTTGYASTDFNGWDPAAKLLLLALMLLGGSAGSTAGSIKMIRLLLILKMLGRELRRLLHPQVVIPIRLGTRVIEESALRGVTAFAILYVALFALGSIGLVLTLEAAGMTAPVLDAMGAVAAAMGNVGPGFGLVGPMASYAPLPEAGKLLLAFLMWVGRLEIFPVLVLLTRDYWRG